MSKDYECPECGEYHTVTAGRGFHTWRCSCGKTLAYSPDFEYVGESWRDKSVIMVLTAQQEQQLEAYADHYHLNT